METIFVGGTDRIRGARLRRGREALRHLITMSCIQIPLDATSDYRGMVGKWSLLDSP
ncbi:hypothetical protein EV649_0446 [Kribbella sp. VKM Ac-2569]|nr:hypothetical protein EV649_0446 [Kribbella sp. VKM Ac-2569]